MLNGCQMIYEERARQMAVEGWTPEHDDHHVIGELVAAAVCYAMAAGRDLRGIPDYWPWEDDAWKPRDDISNLVRAGALIAAEIDRYHRKDEEDDKPAGE